MGRNLYLACAPQDFYFDFFLGCVPSQPAGACFQYDLPVLDFSIAHELSCHRILPPGVVLDVHDFVLWQLVCRYRFLPFVDSHGPDFVLSPLILILA
jgi:hypothetical protein